jgi:alpha-ketoglutarate-dependent taurine dioxygenase
MIETPISKHPWVNEHPKSLRDGLFVNPTQLVIVHDNTLKPNHWFFKLVVRAFKPFI